MEEPTDLKLLQYYRHDMVNELQVIQGYLNLDKTDTAIQKVGEWMNTLHEEQKLIDTNASQFIRWIFMFNHQYNQFQLTYKIDTEGTLSNIDFFMVNYFHEVVEKLSDYCLLTELYYLRITVSDKQPSKIIFQLNITGSFSNNDHVINELQVIGIKNKLDSKIKQKKDEIICTWTYVT